MGNRADDRASYTALRAVASGRVPTPARLAGIAGLALAGAAGAVWLMTQGTYPGSGEQTAMVEDMKDTSQWLAWVLVLAVQTATWLALLPAMWGAVREADVKRSRSREAHAAVLLALLVAPVLAVELFAPSHPVQVALAGRMRVLMVAGIAVGWLGVIAIVRSHDEIRRLADDATQERDDLRSLVGRYLKLRGRLHFVGGALAVIVALAVLSTGGQRNTVVAMETARESAATAAASLLDKGGEGDLFEARDCRTLDESTGSDTGAFENVATPSQAECLAAASQARKRATRFGIEAVWSFGLYYTFALMIVYLPSYLSLAAAGRAIRDRRFPVPVPGDADYDKAVKERKEVTDLLQLEKSPLESLKAAALVLVPLLTSLASSLLGGAAVGK